MKKGPTGRHGPNDVGFEGLLTRPRDSRRQYRLGREVDLVVLNDAPPLLAARFTTTGNRVFCADPDLEHAFRRDAQLGAADLAPFLARLRRVKLDAILR